MMLLFLFGLTLTLSAAEYTCKGEANNNPIYKEAPTFVKQVKNGKLYTTGGEEPKVSVVHMWGTPYEMGFAHGQLVSKEAQKLYSQVTDYMQSQVEQFLHMLPEFLQELIARYGVEGALEMTYLLTKKYTPPRFFEELKGFADGSGIDYMAVVRMHMFPEVIKAQCSMVGAWGPANANNNNGDLVQLRALDWATNGPFQEFPAILVYHPSASETNDFAIISFVGFIGALSGVSDAPMGICEKVWYAYNGTSSREGIPWHFMLRDILQWDKSVDDAINRVNHADRTCSIFIGVGDPEHKFRVMEYAYEGVTVYDDRNFPSYPGHPRREGLVFVNKHVQPSNHPCLGDFLDTFYGNIDYSVLIQAAAHHKTGDTHAAIYDFGNDHLYVTLASIYDPVNGAVPAYNREWSRLTMSDLWKEAIPTGF
eukprot:TRINITY_DN14317_c0_g1_i1.p1 TRINITY_DN14317_c0_g1~~TRINITY_DN14317_c0_g1_i1.p1  ORF type:complete len:423 (-),score=87.84 TRINITY_DN14317_c0_g1_i1:40-1308(-)